MVARRPAVTSVIVDSMATNLQAAADTIVAGPLEFDKGPKKENVGLKMQLDMFSLIMSAAHLANDQFNRATPMHVCTLEVQLGAVTSHVCRLEIAGIED
ncbi:hypothetical protein D1007_01758 [Hordeum vulgare]|nr:hypothetical protein D1007_01758 [Hordeum vulgare]